MKTRVLATILLLGVLGLIVAGCGGGGGNSRNDAYAGSKDEYAAALNSICTSVNQKLKALDLTDIAAYGLHGDEAIGIGDKAIDKIDNLQPPDEVKDSANAFVSKVREEQDKLRDLVDEAKKGDAAKVNEIASEIKPIDDEANNAANEIGASGCAH